MGKITDEKVIRPPVQQIANGTIFKPNKAYLYKMQVQNILAFFLIWLSVILCFLAGAYMSPLESGSTSTAQIIS